MRRYVPWRRRARRAPDHDYQVAALRLQLMVAMAASDGRVQPVEVDRVGRTLDEAHLGPDDSERLEQLLRILLAAPPDIEQVVEKIVEQSPKRNVAVALVRELVDVAHVDDHVDDGEEQLLRLVCGALELEPETLRGRRRRPLDRRERAQLDELLAAIIAA